MAKKTVNDVEDEVIAREMARFLDEGESGFDCGIAVSLAGGSLIKGILDDLADADPEDSVLLDVCVFHSLKNDSGCRFGRGWTDDKAFANRDGSRLEKAFDSFGALVVAFADESVYEDMACEADGDIFIDEAVEDEVCATDVGRVDKGTDCGACGESG